MLVTYMYSYVKVAGCWSDGTFCLCRDLAVGRRTHDGELTSQPFATIGLFYTPRHLLHNHLAARSILYIVKIDFLKGPNFLPVFELRLNIDD
jgi:hypothetical protein